MGEFDPVLAPMNTTYDKDAMRADLMATLLEAFPPRPLDPRLLANDSEMWADFPERVAFECGSRGLCWNMLEPEFVEVHKCALGSLTPHAYAAFVPAYLATLLQGDVYYVISLIVLSELGYESGLEDKFNGRAACLNLAQRAVIVRVLEALTHFEESDPWRAVIDEALASWHEVRDMPFLAREQPPLEISSEDAARMTVRATLGRLSATQAQDADFAAVLEAIEGAFPPRPLGTERLNDADGCWYDYARAREFEIGLRGRTWTELIPEFIQAHYCGLGCMGAAAFAMFLPAYLASMIRDNSMDVSPVLITLTRYPDWGDRFDNRLSGLSQAQRALVPRVLELLPRLEFMDFEAARIAAALACWRDRA
jgi:hypothetical protein